MSDKIVEKMISRIISLHVRRYENTHPGQTIAGQDRAFEKAAGEIYSRFLRESRCPEDQPILSAHDVRRRVEGIRQAANSNDSELAHSQEDDLYRDVLITILESSRQGKSIDIIELIQIALESEDIIFGRFCS